MTMLFVNCSVMLMVFDFVMSIIRVMLIYVWGIVIHRFEKISTHMNIYIYES
jgi:hypothetical protein